MHLSKTLCLFLTAAATTFASPVPISWPWDDPSCEPYDEDGVSHSWSMQFYPKPNCGGEKLIRIDAASDWYAINRCYPVSPATRSFHGTGHTKYAVTWYTDKNCKTEAMTSQYGYIKTKKDMSKGEIKSFYVSQPEDKGPEFPRKVRCGQHNDLNRMEGEPDEVDSRTTEVCYKALGECEDCPSEEEAITTDPTSAVACKITHAKMQELFDGFCEDTGNSCQRFIHLSSGATEADPGYVHCRSAKRDEV